MHVTIRWLVMACLSITYPVTGLSTRLTSAHRSLILYQFPKARFRRALYGIDKIIKDGAEAMKLLLNGATRIPTNNVNFNYRTFAKHGGVRQAFRDFYAIRPNNIQPSMETIKVPGMTGQVGDRKIYISTGGESGRASLTVVTPSKHAETQVDKFIYLD